MKMIAISDFFDLNNLDDLPDEVKKEVSLLGLRKDTERLLSLFDIKNQLTIDEIIVGMSRKYGMNKKRNWVSSTVYNLKRRKTIKEIDGKKKIYEKI